MVIFYDSPLESTDSRIQSLNTKIDALVRPDKDTIISKSFYIVKGKDLTSIVLFHFKDDKQDYLYYKVVELFCGSE